MGEELGIIREKTFEDGRGNHIYVYLAYLSHQYETFGKEIIVGFSGTLGIDQLIWEGANTV